jgi:acetoin:2,6-dichlorophenolindophenol oxidoreductase subunit beta
MTAPEQITYAQALGMALDEAMAADPSVFLIGEDVADEQVGGVFRVSKGLSTKYGTARVRATPITEQAIMGAAVGAAVAGMRPVAEIMFMNFVTVAMDQIVNHAAKLRFMSGGRTPVPLTIRTCCAGGVGFGGQHADMLEAWFAHTPGMKIVAPSNHADAKGLLLSAIEDDDPVMVMEHVAMYSMPGDAPPPGHRVPLGKAAISRPGSDVTLISYGKSVLDCLAAAAELAAEGISVEVVDLRTIAPFDAETVLNSVARTNRAVIVHEAVKAFGVGAEISSRIHEELFGQLRGPVRRIGANYSVVPYAPPLEEAYRYSIAEIKAVIRKAMG